MNASVILGMTLPQQPAHKMTKQWWYQHIVKGPGRKSPCLHMFESPQLTFSYLTSRQNKNSQKQPAHHTLEPLSGVVPASESQLCPSTLTDPQTELTTGNRAICSAANIVAIYCADTIPEVLLKHLTEIIQGKVQKTRGLPAVSFSSSSASSLRSCSFPIGWVAGTVTPGIWGRQHGGVLARGEFRQSRRNFLS